MFILIFSLKGGVGKIIIVLVFVEFFLKKYRVVVLEFDFLLGDFVSLFFLIDLKKNILIYKYDILLVV